MTLYDVSMGRNGPDPGSPPEPEPRTSWLCGCHVERLRLHEDDARHVERCALHNALDVDPDCFHDDPRTAAISDVLRRALQTAVAREHYFVKRADARTNGVAEDFGV